MRLPRGVRRLFRLDGIRRSSSAELDDELDFHFRATVETLVARGMDEDQARAEARRRFGDEEAYRRALRRIDERGTTTRKGRELLDTLKQHLTFAFRSIRRSPGFAAAVVVILALGVGANAVMFGVIDRLLLSPPQHVVEADDVRHVWLERTWFNGTRPLSRTMSYPDYQALRDVEAFEEVAAYTSPRPMTLGWGGEAEQVEVVRASASLFPLLGARPALGRFYGPDDDALGANPVAVLSHEFWTRRFGADRGILGRTLEIGVGRYEVVGVAPRGLTGAELAPVDVWLPIVRNQELEAGGTGWLDGEYSYASWWLQIVVRVEDGVDPYVAADQATSAHRSGRAELIEAGDYDETAEIELGSIIAGRGPEPAAEVRVAAWLGGVSLTVLLIACFNVANLLLARATRWRRELAVRTALGVSRGRLLAQLLTESLLLAALGSAGAWLVVRLGSDALHEVLLPNVAFTDTAAGERLLVFLAVATALTALLAGFLPAYQASRVAVSDALRTGGRGASAGRSRTRVALLVGQAALSAVLLVGAGLFVASLSQARSVELGMDTERVAVLWPVWADGVEPDAREPELTALGRRLEALPEVREVARTFSLPFHSQIALGGLRVPGLDSLPRHPEGGPYMNRVESGYFEAMGLSLVRGRTFRASDDPPGAAPVMVVTADMARAWWPDGDALGQCVLFEKDGEPDPPCTTVVGVVENHHSQDPVEEHPHFLYFLNLSHPMVADRSSMALVIRTAGPAEEALAALGSTARTASSSIRFPRSWTFASVLEPELRSWHLGATMFSLFGLLALVVAALGLYSVLAFDVALRQHELGIRAALGAGISRLVGMVLRKALTLVGLGIALGLVAALVGSRWVAPLLFQVSPRSPAIYAGAAAALLAVAALAGSVPAWRVTRVDPRRALRAE